MLLVGLVELPEQRRLPRLRGLAAEHAVQVDGRVLGRERLLQCLDRGHVGHVREPLVDGRAHAGEQPRELAALRAQGQPVEGVVQPLLAGGQGRDRLLAVAWDGVRRRGGRRSRPGPGTASTRVASCAWCSAHQRARASSGWPGTVVRVALTASRDGPDLRERRVATATSGARPAGDWRARGCRARRRCCTPRATSAAAPPSPREHRAPGRPSASRTRWRGGEVGHAANPRGVGRAPARVPRAELARRARVRSPQQHTAGGLGP